MKEGERRPSAVPLAIDGAKPPAPPAVPPAAQPPASPVAPAAPPPSIKADGAEASVEALARAAERANAELSAARMAQRADLRSLLAESTEIAPPASIPLEVERGIREAEAKKSEKIGAEWQRRTGLPAETHAGFESLWVATRSEWRPILDSSRSYFDPNFSLKKEQIEELSKGIPDAMMKDFTSYLARSTSLTSAFMRRRNFVAAMKDEAELNAAGFTGFTARLLAGFTNPYSIGASVASAGVGGAVINAMKVGRVGVIAIRGAEGAVGNVAAEYMINQEKPIVGDDDVLVAAITGFAMGSTFSLLERTPKGIEADMRRFDQVAQDARVYAARMNARENPEGTPNRSVGAASAVPRVEPTNGSALGTEAKYADAPRAAMGDVRFGVVGRLGSSDDDITRGMTYRLFPDNVGHKGGEMVDFSAMEAQKMIHSRYNVRFSNEIGADFLDYAKEKGWNAYQRLTGQREFMEQVGLYMRDPDRVVTPPISSAAAKLSKIFEDYKWEANMPGIRDGKWMPPVAGFEHAAKFGDNYLPRMVDSRRFRKALHEFGEPAIQRLITNAIRAWNPDIEEKLAEKLGKVWVKRQREVDAGIQAHTIRFLAGDDASSLRMVLREEGINEGEIESLVKHFERRRESAAHPRAKRRMDFDEGYGESMARSLDHGGGEHFLRVADLLINDVSKMFGIYNRSLSGAIALAKSGWASRADFDREIGHMRAARGSADKRDPHVDRDEGLLRYLYDTVATGTGWRDNAGKPLSQSRFGRTAKIVTDFNFVRLGGDFGLAQVSELGNLLFSMGLKTALQSMPSLRAFRRDLVSGRIKQESFAELEAATGMASELRGSRFANRIDDINEVQRTNYETKFWHNTSQGLDIAKRATAIMSGMAPITVLMQRWAMGAAALKVLKIADGTARFSSKRLATMGLDDARIARIKKLAPNVEWENGAMGPRVKRFNLDKWFEQDAEAAEWFVMALSRKTRGAIQENDAGSMAKWMTHPVARIFGQFRNFMINAYEKQLLYNTQHLDSTTAQVFLATMFFGSLAYMARTYRNSFGQSDPSRYREENLSVEKIALASFNMAGWSTFFPMIADTVTGWAGYRPLFAFRNTGLDSALLSNPATDLLDKTGRAVVGAGRAVTDSGYDYSQKDWSALKSVLPWHTMGGVRNLLQWIGSDLPERSEITDKRGR